jgi:hypothetical protein
LNSNGTPVCLNFGTCSINFNIPPYYQCKCQFGYTGSNCQFLPITSTTSSTISLLTTFFQCIDTAPAACEYYRANNWCNDRYFISGTDVSVPRYCPKSCGICQQLSTTTQFSSSLDCIDSQENCVVWAALNLCNLLANQTPHPCRKSCSIC